jgi:hypothetical protein
MRLAPAVAVGAALLFAPAAHAAPAWLPAAPIPGQGSHARDAQAAFGGDGSLVVAWHEGDASSQTIRVAVRPPGGSFEEPVTLAGPIVGLGPPRVAVDDLGTAVVTWIQGAGAKFAVRPPGGPFGLADDVPRPAGENVNSPVEVTFDAQGAALAAWVGSTSSVSGINFHLRASVRPPGGSFGSPESLDNGVDNADAVGTPTFMLSDVSVASSGAGDLIVSWRSVCCLVGSDTASVRVAVRPPGGPFGSSQTVDSIPTASGANVGSPRLAGGSEGSAVVVWSRISTSTTGNVAACTRPPGGTFAGCAIEDVSDTGTNPAAPKAALDAQGNAVAVWTRKAPTGADPVAVQTAERAAGSSQWTQTTTFSEPGIDLTQAQLAASRQGLAAIVWRRGTDRIDGAVRLPGAAFGASQPVGASGTTAVFPLLVMDAEGNGAAAWERGMSPSTSVELAGFDAAGPRLTPSLPSAGDTGQPLAFAVGAVDVWSSVQSIGWSFADGAAATGTPVTHTFERVGGSFTSTVTAVDSLGNSSSASGATQVRDTARPVVSRLRVAPRRFRVARGRTPLVAKRVPRGSKFRFRLSEPATVKIRLERRARRARRGVYRKVAVLTRRHKRTGQNSVMFSGRIKRRALAPGAYRATVRAVDAAGNSSRARRVSFTIAR